MFGMLGRQPFVGRTFTDADVRTAVVVSHGFWQRRLGSDPAVLGRVLKISNHPRTVVGVMPPDFVFPYKTMLGPSGFTRSFDVEAWLPLEFVTADSRVTGVASLTRAARFLSVVGRLKPGVTVPQADAEVRGIASQLAASNPASNRVVGSAVVPLHEQAVGSMRPALGLLLGGVGFVLLMACVNLANLLLARSSARQREMAVRSALGADRARLVRQTLVESLLLSVAGGLLALVDGPLEHARAPRARTRRHAAHRRGARRPARPGVHLRAVVVTGLAIGLVPGSRPHVPPCRRR
jgi:putative ABC transport system permease protein